MYLCRPQSSRQDLNPQIWHGSPYVLNVFKTNWAWPSQIPPREHPICATDSNESPKSGETPTSTKRRIKKIARKPASPHQGKKSVMVFHVFTLTLDSSFMLVGKDWIKLAEDIAAPPQPQDVRRYGVRAGDGYRCRQILIHLYQGRSQSRKTLLGGWTVDGLDGGHP